MPSPRDHAHPHVILYVIYSHHVIYPGMPWQTLVFLRSPDGPQLDVVAERKLEAVAENANSVRQAERRYEDGPYDRHVLQFCRQALSDRRCEIIFFCGRDNASTHQQLFNTLSAP